jgi:glycosidase
MRNFLLFISLFWFSELSAQTVITTTPKFPTQTDKITITFNVKNSTHQNKIAGYTGDVYAHTGVTTKIGSGSPNRWQNVIGSWGNNTIQPKLTRLATDTYELVIDNPRNFYNVTNSLADITELCIVLRSADNGSKQTEDLFIPLFKGGISVVVKSPTVSTNYGDPLRSPVFAKPNDIINIEAIAAEVETTTLWMKLFVNGIEKVSATASTIQYQFNSLEYSSGKNEIKIVAQDVQGRKDSSTFIVFQNPPVQNIAPPPGTVQGINYPRSSTQAVFALFAPHKEFVYLLGDFNDWKVDENYFMKRYEFKPDSVFFWIEMPMLLVDPADYGYRYQFLIDGELRIADPYSEMILDPWNDGEINSSRFPGLPSYPGGKTSNIVSYIYPEKAPYNWRVTDFQKPPKEKLIIYELLVRDFTAARTFKSIKDSIGYLKRLGVNAVELMPVSEFEGNNSWGYNSSFYFAVDKYYGTREALKELIDELHANGIAVILDMVLNHSYGLSPMVQMYWDNNTGRPAANNPWLNQVSPNSVFSWGYDFNHESKNTKYFVDRVNSFWLTEFKFDGFRFDFTKGFTNRTGDGSSYDASRIAILKRMADHIWSVDPEAYIILEHFAPDTEERELTNHGMMVWGNLNYNYNEATMGWVNTSNFGRISYKSRGFTNPNLVGYMESHDEERLMYKNLQFGNASGNYSIKNLNTALERIEQAAAFFITVPGPKMIWQFGELGYDYSINYPSNTSNDRLTPKPPRWDYLNIPERKKLFNVYAALTRLKKAYPVFSTSDFNSSFDGAQKRLRLNHPGNNVALIGNFGVTTNSIAPGFQNTGMWYEFFSGDSMNVTDAGMLISLQPGEYRLYSTQKFASFNTITDVREERELPNQFTLYQNYPNPFNPETIIRYQIPDATNVSLKVYDILGREVAILVNELQQSGTYDVKFSLKDIQRNSSLNTSTGLSRASSTLSSSVYFYRLQAGNFSEVKKMILMK